jgi:hypothetical protein
VAIARKHDHLMAAGGKRLDQTASDEPGGPGHQHALANGERGHQRLHRRAFEPPRAARGQEVAHAEQCCTKRRQRGGNAPKSMIGGLDGRRILRPFDQDREQQRHDGAVVDRKERVIDALGRGKLSADILLDEIHEGDDHLDNEHADHQHRQIAVRLRPAEHDEQTGIEQVADRVQLELVLL